MQYKYFYSFLKLGKTKLNILKNHGNFSYVESFRSFVSPKKREKDEKKDFGSSDRAV